MNERGAKIRFPLPTDDQGYLPFGNEFLWANDCGENCYTIDSIPFFVSLVGVGDIVKAIADSSGVLSYIEHIQYSKHSTLAVVLFEKDRVSELRSIIKGFGCSSELHNELSLVSLDIPPNVDIRKVIDYLDDGEKSGHWEYSELLVWY